MTATFSNRDLTDMVRTLDAALDQSRDGKGDPLVLIEDVRDRIEYARTAAPVREYARQLIEKGCHLEQGSSAGTAILNHVSFLNVHHPDQSVALAAFNDVRHTPQFAGFLASELDGRMFDDGFGDWEELNVAALALSAFGQIMASVVQIELDQSAVFG